MHCSTVFRSWNFPYAYQTLYCIINSLVALVKYEVISGMLLKKPHNVLSRLPGYTRVNLIHSVCDSASGIVIQLSLKNIILLLNFSLLFVCVFPPFFGFCGLYSSSHLFHGKPVEKIFVATDIIKICTQNISSRDWDYPLLSDQTE